MFTFCKEALLGFRKLNVCYLPGAKHFTKYLFSLCLLPLLCEAGKMCVREGRQEGN